jgi:hypothetical protein
MWKVQRHNTPTYQQHGLRHRGGDQPHCPVAGPMRCANLALLLYCSMLTPALKRRYCHLFQLPSSLRDPSPAVFTTGCLAGTITLTTLLHHHRDDPFQNHFLAAGIVCGILAGAALPTCHHSLLQNLQLCLPWFISLALILSAVAHRLIRRFGEERQSSSAEEVGGDKKGGRHYINVMECGREKGTAITQGPLTDLI